MKLPQNSLFAILLRSKWWVSLGAGAVAFGLLRLLVPAPYAAFGASPFLFIGLYLLSKQLRQPGAQKVAAALARARELPAPGFLEAMEAAFRREGYRVDRASGGAADLELTFEGRTTLVACKRWKALRTGVEPLREFDAATAGRGAKRIYIAAGELTEKAKAYAAEKQIRLIDEEELGRLLAG